MTNTIITDRIKTLKAEIQKELSCKKALRSKSRIARNIAAIKRLKSWLPELAKKAEKSSLRRKIADAVARVNSAIEKGEHRIAYTTPVSFPIGGRHSSEDAIYAPWEGPLRNGLERGCANCRLSLKTEHDRYTTFLSDEYCPDCIDDRIIFTHIWVDGFGWENTVYVPRDFAAILIIKKPNNDNVEFEGTRGGCIVKLKGLLKPRTFCRPSDPNYEARVAQAQAISDDLTHHLLDAFRFGISGCRTGRFSSKSIFHPVERNEFEEDKARREYIANLLEDGQQAQSATQATCNFIDINRIMRELYEVHADDDSNLISNEEEE